MTEVELAFIREPLRLTDEKRRDDGDEADDSRQENHVLEALDYR